MCQSFIELIVCKNGKIYLFRCIPELLESLNSIMNLAMTRGKDLAMQKSGVGGGIYTK